MEKIRIKKICLVCKKIFFVIPSYSYAKYCSQKCMGEMRSKSKVKKICKYCKKKFEVKFSDKEAKYCSHKCYAKGRTDIRIEGICKFCGKAFFVISRLKFQKCCSNKCRLEWQSRNNTKKKCEHCGKEYLVTLSKKDKSKYCSIVCMGRAKRGIPKSEEIKRKISKTKSRPKIEKNCIFCNKIFLVAFFEKDKKFCSSECQNKWQSRNNVKKLCLYCKKVFSVKPSCISRRFCSSECYNTWLNINNIKIEKKCLFCDKIFFVVPSEKQRKHCSNECRLKAGFSKEHCKNISKGKTGIRPTKEARKNMSIAQLKYIEKNNYIYPRVGIIEPIFEETVLKKISNLKYEAQKRINMIGIVDFFLPDYGIIIECDEKYHNSSEQRSKDAERDFLAGFIFKYKYQTIRFADTEIANEPKKCIREIKKCIRKKGAISVCA